MPLEIARSLQISPKADAVELAAGDALDGSLVMLAEGLGGKGTGWLPAWIAVRGLLDALAIPGEQCSFVGAAEPSPADQDDSGSLQVGEGPKRVLGKVWTAWRRTPTQPGASLEEACARIGDLVARIPQLGLSMSGQVASCTALVLRGDRVEVAQCGGTAAWRFNPRTQTLESLSVSDTVSGLLQYVEQPGADPSARLAGLGPHTPSIQVLQKLAAQGVRMTFRALGTTDRPARITTEQIELDDVLLLTTQDLFDQVGGRRIAEILGSGCRDGTPLQALCESLIAAAKEAKPEGRHGVVLAAVRSRLVPRAATVPVSSAKAGVEPIKQGPSSVHATPSRDRPDGEAVSATQLLRHPLDYDGRRITTEGRLTYGFEHSNFAGAWAELPPEFLKRHPEWADSAGYAGYVRITGLWQARAVDQYGYGSFGHMGLYGSCLSAEYVDEVPARAVTTVGPGELGPRLGELMGQVVEARVQIVIGHELCKFDEFIEVSDARLGLRARIGHDPTARPARLLLWIEDGAPRILRCEWLGESQDLPVPRISISQLPEYADHIVEVSGALEVGDYWPRLGAFELVPSEFATDPLHSHYGRTEPVPEGIRLWRRRIKASGGRLQVTVRGTVLGEWKKLSAYRLKVSEP